MRNISIIITLLFIQGNMKILMDKLREVCLIALHDQLSFTFQSLQGLCFTNFGAPIMRFRYCHPKECNDW